MIRVEISTYKFLDSSITALKREQLRKLWPEGEQQVLSAFKLQGHAGQAAYGYDVVCAAATNLAATAIASLADIAKIEALEYGMEAGDIYCRIADLSILNEQQFLLSQVILQVFALGIEQIVHSEQAQAGSYIELVYTNNQDRKR